MRIHPDPDAQISNWHGYETRLTHHSTSEASVARQSSRIMNPRFSGVARCVAGMSNTLSVGVADHVHCKRFSRHA